ncbi:MAG: DUF6036 family nucleotidyltransferase [Acidithiobacillus sp.]
MLDEQLEHLIRASGAIIGDREVVVIGSQSILPWLKKHAGKPPKTFPEILKFSMEADIIPIDDNPKKSDEIDGSLGEDSLFHNTHGYYAQGVSMKTARAPKGWLSRCYPLVNGNTWDVVGRCMHPNDLFVAKLLANRPKDRDFLAAMIECGIVRRDAVLHGLPHVPDLTEQEMVSAQNRIGILFARADEARAESSHGTDLERDFHSGLRPLPPPVSSANGEMSGTVQALVKDANANAFALVENDQGAFSVPVSDADRDRLVIGDTATFEVVSGTQHCALTVSVMPTEPESVTPSKPGPKTPDASDAELG